VFVCNGRSSPALASKVQRAALQLTASVFVTSFFSAEDARLLLKPVFAAFFLADETVAGLSLAAVFLSASTAWAGFRGEKVLTGSTLSFEICAASLLSAACSFVAASGGAIRGRRFCVDDPAIRAESGQVALRAGLRLAALVPCASFSLHCAGYIALCCGRLGLLTSIARSIEVFPALENLAAGLSIAAGGAAYCCIFFARSFGSGMSELGHIFICCLWIFIPVQALPQRWVDISQELATFVLRTALEATVRVAWGVDAADELQFEHLR